MRSERELSPEELAFVASVKKEKAAEETPESPRKRRGLLRRVFRARNFAIATAVVTLLVCFVFIYTVESIPASYGGLDALRLLATVGESGGEWGGMLSQAGFGWVNEFLNFYDSRWIVLAIMASVGLVVTLAFSLWAVFSKGDFDED